VLRFTIAITAAVAAIAGGFLPTTASAQEEFVRQRLLVHTFDGPRGSLGRRVGDEISSAIDDGAKGRDLIVVDRDEMLRQLEKSGFNPDSVLLESEMRDMTAATAPNEYVIGRVVATNGTSVSLNGVLMLTRDSGLTSRSRRRTCRASSRPPMPSPRR